MPQEENNWKDIPENMTDVIGSPVQIFIIGERQDGAIVATVIESKVDGEARQSMKFSIEASDVGELQMQNHEFPTVKEAYSTLSLILHRAGLLSNNRKKTL